MHKLITLICNKEELPHQWKESIVVPIHKKGEKTDCSNYRGISLLSTSYKILSNILLSRLICRRNYWGPPMRLSTRHGDVSLNTLCGNKLEIRMRDFKLTQPNLSIT
jgi:hypothetical protein